MRIDMHQLTLFIGKLYFQFIAWIYDHRLCTRFGTIHHQLAKLAWASGYMAAVKDLAANQCCHMRSMELLCIERSVYFHPTAPRFYSKCPDSFEYWDEGYDRAIILKRLGYNPYELAELRHELAYPLKVSSLFESAINTVQIGALHPDPETYRWRNGEYLPCMNALKIDIDNAYRKYAEQHQQIVGAHTPLCNAEFNAFASKDSQ
jgi:hypothetical protein